MQIRQRVPCVAARPAAPISTMISTPRPTTAQRIWSDPTCMLIIFAGGSAEFALHPNVDWLFYTGKLPTDPIGRFFSTIDYLREMLVASPDKREQLAKTLRSLHTDIEHARGGRIPDAAYRDVLCMDIYYSIQAVPLVFGQPLTTNEKDEVVAELVTFGDQMGIPNLPQSYDQMCEMRLTRFQEYGPTEYTDTLLASYQRALGSVGYHSLLGLYPLLLEPELMSKLPIGPQPLTPLLRRALYPLCRTNLIHYVYRLGLPARMRSVVHGWSESVY